MQKLILPIFVVAGALVLAGCASSPCRDVLSYRSAKPHALPKIPDGLKPLTPDPAFQVPPGDIATRDPESRAQCVAYPPQVVTPGEQAESAG